MSLSLRCCPSLLSGLATTGMIVAARQYAPHALGVLANLSPSSSGIFVAMTLTFWNVFSKRIEETIKGTIKKSNYFSISVTSVVLSFGIVKTISYLAKTTFSSKDAIIAGSVGLSVYVFLKFINTSLKCKLSKTSDVSKPTSSSRSTGHSNTIVMEEDSESEGEDESMSYSTVPSSWLRNSDIIVIKKDSDSESEGKGKDEDDAAKIDGLGQTNLLQPDLLSHNRSHEQDFESID